MTCFSIEIPLIFPTPTMAHLLIVDDEESICWCLARLCADLGHTAATAASAEDALAMARSQPPDAIVLDIRLPGVDGLVGDARRLRSVAGDDSRSSS